MAFKWNTTQLCVARRPHHTSLCSINIAMIHRRNGLTVGWIRWVINIHLEPHKQKNEGNYFFVLSLERSVPRYAHKDGKIRQPILSSTSLGSNSLVRNIHVRMRSFFMNLPESMQHPQSFCEKWRKQVGFRRGARSFNKTTKEPCKKYLEHLQMKRAAICKTIKEDDEEEEENFETETAEL